MPRARRMVDYSSEEVLQDSRKAEIERSRCQACWKVIGGAGPRQSGPDSHCTGAWGHTQRHPLQTIEKQKDPVPVYILNSYFTSKLTEFRLVMRSPTLI
jgi:hypothetical protein